MIYRKLHFLYLTNNIEVSHSIFCHFLTGVSSNFGHSSWWFLRKILSLSYGNEAQGTHLPYEMNLIFPKVGARSSTPEALTPISSKQVWTWSTAKFAKQRWINWTVGWEWRTKWFAQAYLEPSRVVVMEIAVALSSAVTPQQTSLSYKVPWAGVLLDATHQIPTQCLLVSRPSGDGSTT